MRRITSAFLVSIALAAAPAMGQIIGPVKYSISDASEYRHEYCLPPCMCPGFLDTSSLVGTFTLEYFQSDDAWDYFYVTDVEWKAPDLKKEPVKIQGKGIYSLSRDPVAKKQQLIMDILENGKPPVFFDSGVVAVTEFQPVLVIEMFTAVEKCEQRSFTLVAKPPAYCYADCDGVDGLAIDDFICFQTYFAFGLARADCDNDFKLTVDDFICFQTSYAVGC